MTAFAELGDALTDHAHPNVEQPDPGFHTSRELAEKWNYSLPHTMYLIGQMMAADPPQLERRVYRVQKHTRLYPVPFYKDLRNASRKA